MEDIVLPVPAVKAPEVGLQRQIGLLSAINFLINIIIGSGVFITPGKVLDENGSVGMTMVVWVTCGVIALLVCLPYGELSTVVPKSGGIYIYLLTAFRGLHPFYGELPAFIYIWVTYVVIEPCNIAVCAFLLADYIYVILETLLSNVLDPDDEILVKSAIGIFTVVLTGAVNCLSVKVYALLQDILAYLKFAAILFIVFCGLCLEISGNALNIGPTFEGTRWTVEAITHSFYLALFAYDGGWMVTGITDEIKNPERNILLSIVIMMIITTSTYLLLNLTFLTVLTAQEMSSAPAIVSDFATKLFGSSGGVISATIISLCLVTTIMSTMFFTSRIGYMAAKEGHMVEILCYLHKTQQTPSPAVVVQVLLSVLYFVLGGNVSLLIQMSSFSAWFFYGVTMITVFVLRKKRPEANRPFRVPSAIPVMGTAVCFTLAAISLSIADTEVIFTIALCVTVLTFLYYVFIIRACTFHIFNVLQKKCEQMFSLVPPPKEEL